MPMQSVSGPNEDGYYERVVRRRSRHRSHCDKCRMRRVKCTHSEKCDAVPKKRFSSRKRLVTACVECRLRRLKCDKGEPCERCIKDKLRCYHYPGGIDPNKKQTREDVGPDTFTNDCEVKDEVESDLDETSVKDGELDIHVHHNATVTDIGAEYSNSPNETYDANFLGNEGLNHGFKSSLALDSTTTYTGNSGSYHFDGHNTFGIQPAIQYPHPQHGAYNGNLIFEGQQNHGIKSERDCNPDSRFTWEGEFDGSIRHGSVPMKTPSQCAYAPHAAYKGQGVFDPQLIPGSHLTRAMPKGTYSYSQPFTSGYGMSVPQNLTPLPSNGLPHIDQLYPNWKSPMARGGGRIDYSQNRLE